MIQEALGIRKASKPCAWRLPARKDAEQRIEYRHALCIRLLASLLKAREAQYGQIVFRLYARIADARCACEGYALGGARLYRDQWLHHQHYGLAVAGLIWLAGNPITPSMVRAATARRDTTREARLARFIASRPQNSSQAQKQAAQEQAVEVWEQVPQKQIQHVHVTQ
jgi:hypothetical protein